MRDPLRGTGTQALNPGVLAADTGSMLLTIPLARAALLVVLVAFATALMLVRVSAGQERGATTPAGPIVSFARHTPGSEAHERHEYRLRVAQAIAASAN